MELTAKKCGNLQIRLKQIIWEVKESYDEIRELYKTGKIHIRGGYLMQNQK